MKILLVKIVPFSHRVFSLCIISSLVLVLLNSAAQAGKLYKWVDAKGNISYQDQPPPQNANVLRETSIDENGSLNDQPQDQQTVIVYTIPNCTACASLLSHLVEVGVPVEEQDLKNNREAQQRILELTDSLIAPTLLINGQALPNPSLENLNSALETAGYKTIKPKPQFIVPPVEPENNNSDSNSDNQSSDLDSDIEFDQEFDQELQPAS